VVCQNFPDWLYELLTKYKTAVCHYVLPSWFVTLYRVCSCACVSAHVCVCVCVCVCVWGGGGKCPCQMLHFFACDVQMRLCWVHSVTVVDQ
jgi:hypothetical protein